MELKNCIKEFDLDHLQQKVNANDWDSVGDFFDVLTKKTFTVADTGVDRKLLHYWDKMELLPFQKSKGWDKFSFIEMCWMKLLMEFKSLDIGIKNLQKIKTFFIDDKAFMLEFMRGSSDADSEPMEHEFSDGKKVILNDELIDKLMENQIVKFSILLVKIILTKSNTCVYIENTGDINIIDVNLLQEQPNEQIPLWLDFFSKKSIAITNITKIISEITATHESFTIKDNTIYTQESAVAILKKMFQQEDHITEISIRLIDDARPLLTITKKLTFEQINQKINTLQRKGVFMDMTIKSRDGKVTLFETQELIRL